MRQFGEVPGAGAFPQLQPTEALEYFANKLPLRSRTLEELVDRAQANGQAIGTDLLAQLHELLDAEIAKAIEQGTPAYQFVRDVDEMLTRLGLTPAGPHRLDTILRTNLNTAYMGGRLDMLDEPEMREIFVGMQYFAVGDGATRKNHLRNHLHVWPMDDPALDVIMPPNGYRCRCTMHPVSHFDMDAEGLRFTRGVLAGGEPDPGFGFNGANVFRRNGVLAGLSPAARKEATAAVRT